MKHILSIVVEERANDKLAAACEIRGSKHILADALLAAMRSEEGFMHVVADAIAHAVQGGAELNIRTMSEEEFDEKTHPSS